MAALCPDWILSNNSNVHVAVNREWFTTYTPYKTHLTNNIFDAPPMQVAGIGTVTIQTIKHKVNKGKRSRRTITLQNVLHAPTSICGILGRPFLVENKGVLDFADMVLRRQDGSIIAMFESHRKQTARSAGVLQSPGLPRLKLYHDPDITFAESKLKPDTAWIISVTWPQAERKKYIDHCTAIAVDVTSTTSKASKAPQTSNAPYTAAEKDWLKHKSGHSNEFHFLRGHGLSIYKDEDRKEGRELLRALMADESNDEEEAEDDEDEWDPTGHQADYAFKHNELEFIEKHWGTSENFLITHGLKFYNDDDLEEGRVIVRGFMAEDD